MGKPIAFDFFCGAGGCALGLKQAGFYVIGFDIKKPSNYGGDEFIQADIHDIPIKDIKYASFLWASPPCQAFSQASARWSNTKNYPNLIPITRSLLKGHPYTCIENVSQAPIRPNLTLWGPQFGLIPNGKKDGLWRKRTFELSFFAWQLPKPKMDRSGRYASIAGSMGCTSTFYRRKAKGLRGSLSTAEGKAIMGIPQNFKITRKELVQSVPPAYSRYIGMEALARMCEDGYVSHTQQQWNAKLEKAETLTAPPF